MASLEFVTMVGFLEVVAADRNLNGGCSWTQARLVEAISLVAYNTGGDTYVETTVGVSTILVSRNPIERHRY
jgi:hypothetical protein